MTTIESHRWVTHCASYISCAKKIQDSFSLARLHAGRQAVSFASLRRSSIGSELFELCAFLGGIFFRSRVEIFCSRVSCFLCCSEDGLALFWRLGALRVAVLTRSRLLVFRILFRGGFLLGAFSAGPAPPVVQLWARVEVRSGSVAKLSLGQLLHFRAFAFPSEKPSRDCSVAQSSGAARRVMWRNSWQLRELVEW